MSCGGSEGRWSGAEGEGNANIKPETEPWMQKLMEQLSGVMVQQLTNVVVKLDTMTTIQTTMELQLTAVLAGQDTSVEKLANLENIQNEMKTTQTEMQGVQQTLLSNIEAIRDIGVNLQEKCAVIEPLKSGVDQMMTKIEDIKWEGYRNEQVSQRLEQAAEVLKTGQDSLTQQLGHVGSTQHALQQSQHEMTKMLGKLGSSQHHIIGRLESLETTQTELFGEPMAKEAVTDDATRLKSKPVDRWIPLCDVGWTKSPCFRSDVPPEIGQMIYSSNLHPDSKVCVISVAGIECRDKKLLASVLVRYLEYRTSTEVEEGPPSADAFFKFLSTNGTVDVSLVGRGVYMWSRSFELADNVAGFIMCSVGDLDRAVLQNMSDASLLLSWSVLCSSVQLVHLAPTLGVPVLGVWDYLYTVMRSTDFVLHGSSSIVTQNLFPCMHLLVPKFGSPNGDDSATSSEDTFLKSTVLRAKEALRRRQMESFLHEANLETRRGQIKWSAIDNNVACSSFRVVLQVDNLPRTYVSAVFDLFESVVGRRDSVPPIKYGFDGQPVTLGDFEGFVRQVYMAAGRSGLIGTLTRGFLNDCQSDLRLGDVTDFQTYFPKTVKRVGGPSGAAIYNEMHLVENEFNSLHAASNWNECCHHNIMCQFVSRYSRLYKSLVAVVSKSLTSLWGYEDISEAAKGNSLELIPWDQLSTKTLLGECQFSVQSPGTGERRTTQRYIEDRNRELDINRLIQDTLSSVSSSHADWQLAQYGWLVAFVISKTLNVWIDESDREWALVHSAFDIAYQCRRNLFVDPSETKKRVDLTLYKFDCMVGKQMSQSGFSFDSKEIKLIVADQRNLLHQQIKWRADFGLLVGDHLTNVSFADMDRFIHSVLLFHMYEDRLAFCLRKLPIDLRLIIDLRL